jgi:hypothetical protein
MQDHRKENRIMATETLPLPEITAGTPARTAPHAAARPPEAHTPPRGPAVPPTQAGMAGGGGGGEFEPYAATPDDAITGIPAYGTLIQVLSDPGPPEVYTNIAGAGDITGPNTALAEAETTSHSTGAPVRTFIPTLIDPGDISFPCYWNPSDPTQSVSSPYGMEYLFWNRVITKFQLVNTDPTHRTRQFSGYPKTLGETYPVAGVCTRQIAIRITTPYKDVPSAISLTPSSATVVTAGQPTDTFEVKTGGSNAPWIPIPSAAWITITTPTGSTVGDASVDYAVAANASGSSRTGTINIAALALTFTIDQS